MLSTMKTSALIFAGLSFTAKAMSETFENALWTIELDSEVDTGFLYSGIVSYNGKPLCDDMMTDVAATVLCRHLEIGNYGKYDYAQDVGSDDFGADNLVCPDDAMNLGDCSWDITHNCRSNEGVRLKCAMWSLQKPPMLADHKHQLPRNMGLVLYNLKPLCDDHVDTNAADALCRTMNLGQYGEFANHIEVPSDDFGADDLICPEDAQSIHDCEFIHHDQENCSKREGVILVCSDGFWLVTPEQSHFNEGFVLYRGQAICEVGDMTPLAANLLCQNMGMGTTGIWETRDILDVTDAIPFGADNPSCQRGETHLDQCDFSVTEDMPCSRYKALYLTCSFDGWSMLPADEDDVHGADRDHSGFVHYNGKPLCDDYMSNHEASVLCHTMHYGQYKDVSLRAFHPDTPFHSGGDWRGTWEAREVGTDEFGADSLYCAPGSRIESINDCDWSVQGFCNGHEGVWLNCHKGWQLEKSIWGGDDDRTSGFLTFNDETVCKENFDDHTANVMCRTWFGPHAHGKWQQKANTSTMIWGQSPSVTLDCPANAHTVEECTRGEPEERCWFTDAVHLECVM